MDTVLSNRNLTIPHSEIRIITQYESNLHEYEAV